MLRLEQHHYDSNKCGDAGGVHEPPSPTTEWKEMVVAHLLDDLLGGY